MKYSVLFNTAKMKTHASFMSSLNGGHITTQSTVTFLYTALLYSTSLQTLWLGLSWNSLLFTQV